MAALVGLAIVAPVTCAQTVTGVDGSIIVVERSVLGDRLAHDMATENTSTVRLAPRRDSTWSCPDRVYSTDT
jgi:hypothetical protein